MIFVENCFLRANSSDQQQNYLTMDKDISGLGQLLDCFLIVFIDKTDDTFNKKSIEY